RDGRVGFEAVGNVRIAVLVPRRGHADDDGLAFAHAREIRGGGEAFFADEFLDGLGPDVLDVTAPGIDRLDFGCVNVQTQNVHAAARELQAQRQANVTQTDDGDFHFCQTRIRPAGCR